MTESKYIDYMEELSKEDIYEGLLGHGLFSEKLPPILTSETFCQYCMDHEISASKKHHQYIKFSSIRNTNVPREFGIPSPFSYARLCNGLSENWDNLIEHFRTQTESQEFKISRIHIRKQKHSKTIFKMNYNDWKVDGTPELSMRIGARYIVSADISTCFPSIYSHAIPWALVGKKNAKETKGDSLWYNTLDTLVQNQTDGETHGLLIGPHASNLIAEIILTKIDNALQEKWKYIRNIDDYTCYVRSRDEADRFIAELTKELRFYRLDLNSKKTSIMELPQTMESEWVNKLKILTGSNSRCLSLFDSLPSYRAVQILLDEALKLMKENNGNSAIMKYVMAIIAGKKTLKRFPSTIRYYIKTIFHYALIYPYLVTSLEEFLFAPFGKYIEKNDLSDFLNMLYDRGIETLNYEASYYAIYFSLYMQKKYGKIIDINNVSFENAIGSENCIFMLFTYLYCKERKLKDKVNNFKEDAKERNEQEDYWLYFYEVLSVNELKNEWKAIKREKVSFISWDKI